MKIAGVAAAGQKAMICLDTPVTVFEAMIGTTGILIEHAVVWRDASRRATSPRAVQVGSFSRPPASRVNKKAGPFLALPF
ncbi:MAG: hypothetical protein Q7S20_00110 [Gemmatimonadaceae bacterium]|nr:hypothetical protein [Gemmatimonadaceae bacterium]